MYCTSTMVRIVLLHSSIVDETNKATTIRFVAVAVLIDSMNSFLINNDKTIEEL